MTAWVLLLVCAWMGTGGVLHHTESEARPLTNSSTARLHRQTAAAPVDSCAACEWTQGLQGRTLSVFRLQSPLLFPRLRFQTAAPRLTAFVLPHRSSRAPPISSAS